MQDIKSESTDAFIQRSICTVDGGRWSFWDEAGLLHTESWPTYHEAVFHLGAYCNQLNQKKPAPPLNLHEWVIDGVPGIFDTIYVCNKCGRKHMTSVDKPGDMLPLGPCRGRD